MAAMDRWTFHLVEKHPGVDAPCLAYLDAARQRLHERREGLEAATDQSVTAADPPATS